MSKKTDINAFIKIVEYINAECNQEFLRLRVGDMYFNGSSNILYARISSIYFNWFPYLWQIVYCNQKTLSNITITTDEQLGRPYKTYKIEDDLIEDYPINDFILLKENPILENINTKYIKNLLAGSTLLEAFGNYGPYHTLRLSEAYRYDYLINYFK